MVDPIRGDAARDELDEMGLRYFVDVRATVRRFLERMRPFQRAAFAAAVAERPLREDEQQPERERLPGLVAWRPVLDSTWRRLAGDARAANDVATAVGHFYLSPHYHERRHDDPADAEDHAAMAAFYAAECCLHGCLEFASWAGWRGFDWVTVRAAADPEWPRRRPVEVSPYAWELAHPRVQAELDRQLADLEVIAVEGEVLLDDEADRRPLLRQLRTG